MVEIVDSGATRKLLEVALRVQKAIDRKGLRRGAKVVQREAKRQAPVSDPDDLPDGRSPGDLRKSVKIRAGKRSGWHNFQTIEIYSNLKYAGPVHWGWPDHNIEPNRFLWDSLSDVSQEVFMLFQDIVREETSKLN